MPAARAASLVLGGALVGAVAGWLWHGPRAALLGAVAAAAVVAAAWWVRGRVVRLLNRRERHRLRRAELSLRAGYVTEGTAVLRAVADDVRAEPRLRAFALLALGRQLSARDRWDDAVDALQAAGRLDPRLAEQPATRAVMAVALTQAGRGAEARALPGLAASGSVDDQVLLAGTYAGEPDAAARATGLLTSAYRSAGLAPVEVVGAGAGLGSLTTVVGDEAAHGPLVTVVMPAFRAEDTMRYAVGSLLAQTWRDLEVVVVDDVSPDGTLAVAEELARQDDRVRVVRHEVNSGAYAARNTGLAAARGEFVTVQDADDWSHAQRLELQLRPLLDDPALSSSMSDLVRVDERLGVVSTVRRNYSSFLVRRSHLDRAGTWDAVRVAADHELVQRVEAVLGAASSVRVLPGVPLMLCLARAASLTGSGPTGMDAVFHVLGARRQYTEAHAWWRAQPSFATSLPYVAGAPRPFPAPDALLPPALRAAAPRHVVVADLTAAGGRVAAALARAAELAPEGPVALVHLPLMGSTDVDPVADDVWAAAQRGAVRLLSTADVVDVATVEWIPPTGGGPVPLPDVLPSLTAASVGLAPGVAAHDAGTLAELARRFTRA